MIPLGNETVTMIKRVETADEAGRTRVGYEKHVLAGCSWRERTVWQRFDTEIMKISEITCRIPAGQARPRTGDYLFLGEIPEEIAGTRDIQNAMQAHRDTGAMQVTSVGNHAQAGMPFPHWAARGG